MDEKIIISASRRTDIPAFYSDWLIEQLNRGLAEVTNPYNHTVYSVPLSPASVHSIVLWSKDFAPLLKKIHALKRYELFFMFTLNDSFFLEPQVPSLDARFAQLDFIIRQFDKERLIVRFDPVVHWRDRAGIRNNLDEFKTIIKKDPSQRKECQCTFSRDIGDYTQKCKHGCLYCYANPDILLNEGVKGQAANTGNRFLKN